MFMQNPALLRELVSKADMRAWCLVSSFIILILGFLFFFPLLFALQIDGDIDISFAAVFAPLWLAYLIIWLVMLSGISDMHICLHAHNIYNFFKFLK